MYVINFSTGALCRGEAISRLCGEEIPRASGETISRSCPDLQTCCSLYVQG